MRFTTTEKYWIPAVNKLGTFGTWTFAQFESVYEMEKEFATLIGDQLLLPIDEVEKGL
ncbi:MAG: hypothetical protein J5858_17545 [Lentisphaeria bacterium]|nr:hypothetical protein [Lentisphaeria bacterium]